MSHWSGSRWAASSLTESHVKLTVRAVFNQTCWVSKFFLFKFFINMLYLENWLKKKGKKNCPHMLTKICDKTAAPYLGQLPHHAQPRFPHQLTFRKWLELIQLWPAAAPRVWLAGQPASAFWLTSCEQQRSRYLRWMFISVWPPRTLWHI